MMIYADNAATTKLDIDAFEAMRPYMLENYGNASQPYKFSRLSKKALQDARAIIASCINASPEEIFFTSGGTESDNWAIKGLLDYSNKRATITSRIEHHAILNACLAIERLGFPVSYLPVDKHGIVLVESLKDVLSENTKLVSVMLANNEIGTIEPIAELASLTHRYGAFFHTDAVQAVGHIPVDVKALDIDMLSASGHKFNAPKGVGFFYLKKGTKIFPYVDGGAQESGLRAGTENVASIVAMAYALYKNCNRMKEVSERLYHMENVFLHILDDAEIDYIRNGAVNHIPGNISISIKNVAGEMLLHRLDLKGVCISTGSACDSVNTRISHVIRAIDVATEYAEGTVRISFGALNDEAEAIEVAKAIIDVLK
jgi:cysteine desulfurase